MTLERHPISVGDTLTPLGVQLKQRNATGVLTAVNLDGMTVKFSLVAADGTVLQDETTDGVTVVDPDNGLVQYQFAAGDVASEGEHFGWFSVYAGSHRDTYPVGGRKLLIEITAAD